MKKIALFMACVSMLFGDTGDFSPTEDRRATEQAKTIRWKAAAFAGTVLLAIVAGTVVIALDGGTPNHQHSHHHRGDHGSPDHHHSTHHHGDHGKPNHHHSTHPGDCDGANHHSIHHH